MPLKTLVKVGNISNLSDARYCSGMGVDILGFRVIESQANNMPHKLFQEIRGWISGPKIAAEIYGVQNHDLSVIVSNYRPDYFEMSYAEFKENHKRITLPAIVYLSKDEICNADLDSESENIAYLVIDEDDSTLLKEYSLPYPVLLKVNSNHALDEKLGTDGVAGLALNGSPELRPGYKDYSELATILESLDEL